MPSISLSPLSLERAWLQSAEILLYSLSAGRGSLLPGQACGLPVLPVTWLGMGRSLCLI